MTCPALAGLDLPEVDARHVYATAEGGVRKCVRCDAEVPLVEVVE